MANTVFIKVTDLVTTLASFDQIQVHRASAIAGTYTEITTVSTRITLNNQDNLYEFADSTGVSTDFYKTAFFNSTTSTLGTLSDAFAPIALAQLLENMEVEIFISKNVKNTGGINLTDNLNLYFTTTYNPLYCGVDKITLEAGTFLTNVVEDTINRAIFEASREADILTFNPDAAARKSPLYLHARRRWTCCSATATLINNLIGGKGGGVKSKRLGDFSVEYNSIGIENMLGTLKECMKQWEPQLNSAGAATQKPLHVVKGDLDPDRPDVGRSFHPNAIGGLPIANVYFKRTNQRRYRKGSLPAGLRSWKWK